VNKIIDCYNTWSKSYYSEYYKSSNNYPPIHVNIVKNSLKKYKSKTLLDVGCGPASMLRTLNLKKINCYGFDLTPSMIDEAKKILKRKKQDNNLWVGNATKKDDYKKGLKSYDACICFGVFPHLKDKEETKVFKNILSVLKSRGVALIEARNSLFSLFTQNRLTSQFYKESLINKKSKISKEKSEIKKIFTQMDKRLFMDQPEVRKGKGGEPGYDEILSKSNNPFILREKMLKAGFSKVEPLFYHYHAFPPVYRKYIPQTYLKRSLELENPNDWRGHFMASAFILCGIK
tara:strand:+ start:34581 stop:35447 length:867 start_codon:yes stop_codon:yes gene_type:complete